MKLFCTGPGRTLSSTGPRAFNFAFAALLAIGLTCAGSATAQTIIAAPGPSSPIPPRYIYAVTSDGDLLLYVDGSTDNSLSWIKQGVRVPAVPRFQANNIKWTDFATVTAGGDGVLYAVDQVGNLFYLRLIDANRNDPVLAGNFLSWSPDSGTILGTGFPKETFGFSRLTDTSGMLSRAIWVSGGLFYKHGWLAGGLVETKLANWTHGGAGTQGVLYTAPKPSKSFTSYIEGGSGLEYAFDSGNLVRFRYTRALQSDGQTWGGWADTNGVPQVLASGLPIGSGWNFPRVTAEPGEYAVEAYVSTLQSVNSSSSWKIATMSVAPGDTVSVRASTFSPSYTVKLLRLQRQLSNDSKAPYGLIDGVQYGVTYVAAASAGQNFKKAENFQMHTTGANWASDGANIQLPANAPSGIYAAEVTTPSGGRYLAPFIVRPPAGATAKNIAVIANTSTWNVYNQWGGGSRYHSWNHPELQDTTGQEPVDLSFERPFDEGPPLDGDSIGLLDRDPRVTNHQVRAEVWVTSWLDSLAQSNPAYAYDVFSDVDLDYGTGNLDGHKVVLLDTHPEYWSDNMLDALVRFINLGGDVIYAAGNGLYQRVTVNSDGTLRNKNGYGGNCYGTKGTNQYCSGRELLRVSNDEYPAGRSERAILGEAYEDPDSFKGDTTYPFTVSAKHPFLTTAAGGAGNQLAAGATFGDVAGLNGNYKAAGWETDQWGYICNDFDNSVCSQSHGTVVGTSYASVPVSSWTPNGADVVYHRTNNGNGWVFSIGSLSFSGVLAIDPTCQRIVQNALDYAINNTPALQ